MQAEKTGRETLWSLLPGLPTHSELWRGQMFTLRKGQAVRTSERQDLSSLQPEPSRAEKTATLPRNSDNNERVQPNSVPSPRWVNQLGNGQ